MAGMPRETVVRRSLKAKDTAAAVTVAASAQAPAIRTSGTEEQSLSLPASHLGAADDDEDDDETTMRRAKTTSLARTLITKNAFHGSREMRHAYSGHGAGRSRRAGAQYAPYIDKVKCWAKQTRRVIKNATVVKTMTLWLTTQLLGDKEHDFSEPSRMKKGRFKLHVHAMQYELKHGREDDGNHYDLDCVVTLSKTAPVRNMFEAIEKFHGVRMQLHEGPVLANTHEVGTREMRIISSRVAEPGYSHKYNASHVKTWDKYRHLADNVIKEVDDDERLSSTRDAETRTNAGTQTRAGSATETAAVRSRETVLRRRLGRILEQKYKEFPAWRRDTTDPTKTLMRWLTHGHAGYGKDKKAPRKWRPHHVWSELKDQNQDN